MQTGQDIKVTVHPKNCEICLSFDEYCCGLWCGANQFTNIFRVVSPLQGNALLRRHDAVARILANGSAAFLAIAVVRQSTVPTRQLWEIRVNQITKYALFTETIDTVVAINFIMVIPPVLKLIISSKWCYILISEHYLSWLPTENKK